MEAVLVASPPKEEKSKLKGVDYLWETGEMRGCWGALLYLLFHRGTYLNGAFVPEELSGMIAPSTDQKLRNVVVVAVAQVGSDPNPDTRHIISMRRNEDRWVVFI